jgi:hypothetical protein
MLSEAYREATKNSSVFDWHKWFNEGWMLKSQMKTMLITFFDSKGTVLTLNSFHNSKRLTKLITRKYWSSYMKVFIKKGLNFIPMIRFFTMTMLKLTTCCQAVSGPNIDYWNRILTLLPWLGSEWLLAISKNKVCLKGMKISGYWRHPKNVTALKAIPQVFQKCFQQWQHHWAKCIAVQGEYFKGNPPQKVVSIWVCV